ncbi:MAG: lipopolysaccharide biosynthesis protein [Candidatus Lokiarchaeota archaeon]|nr:lipopolysaccharide biosynthesis protein [Candidatus Lokiarchaeota archaeon]
MKRTHLALIALVAVGPALLLWVGAAVMAPASGQGSPTATRVLLLSKWDGMLGASLQLDADSIDVTITDAGHFGGLDLDDFDVVILDDTILPVGNATSLVSWASSAGNGVIVILGEETTAAGNSTLLEDLDLVPGGTTLAPNDQGVHALAIRGVDANDPNSNHPILSGGIVLNTAPGTANYTRVGAIDAGTIPYVTIQLEDGTPTSYPWLAGRAFGASPGPNAFLFAAWMQVPHETVDANEQLLVWPYFNYLMFVTVQSAAGKAVPSFADWAYSPVPHTGEQVLLGCVVLAAGVISTALFVHTRRKSRKAVGAPVSVVAGPGTQGMAPQAPAAAIQPSAGEQPAGAVRSGLVAVDGFVSKDNLWERIGFHRQLSGFLKLFFLMIMLLVPQLLVTILIMPRFLNPYPQASGWYSYTLRFFEAIWLLFDVGLNYAMGKFFAEHRLERPEKAFHYIQIFVWWEIMSGVVQLSMFAFLGSIVFPHTEFSYLSWMFIIHSLIQFPGFYQVFQYTFQGLQRSDLETIAYALQVFVLRLVCQVATIPLFRAVYSGMPQYGAAFGAAIGLLTGQLLGDVVLLAVTLGMYKKLGLPVPPMFLASFSTAEFKEALKFGIKMALGNVWVPAVWLLQVYLIGVYLPNSSAEQGFFEFAFLISTIPQAVALLMSSMLGGLTEACKYGKNRLWNYITGQGFKWGSIWTWFLCAVFLAIGNELVLGAAGPVWERAAVLLPWLLVYRMVGPFSWQADWEFAAADKPLYAGIAWVVEQGIRAALLLVLVPAFKTMEMAIWSYIISLSIKDVLVVVLMRKKVHAWDWNPWQSFVAPALASATVFVMLKLMATYVKTGIGMIDAVLLFVTALFLFGHVHAFFVGFFGGYDDNTLAELDLATGMITGIRGFARLYYHMTRAGSRLSPLHGKFKNKVYEDAAREAAELTRIKVKIA